MDVNLHVLIVEDHDNLRDMLVRHLGQHGYLAVGTSDAIGLQELMSRQVFDAVVLDLTLPDEDGLSIAKRLRASCPGIFIVMMTARNSNADRILGYDSGADVYITKPSSGEELLAALNSWKRRANTEPEVSSRIQFNVQARELIGLGRVALGAAETTLLQCLCLAPNLRLEHFRLLDALGYSVDAKGKAALEVHMARLRKKLLEVGCAKPAIKAIRSEGYQLVEPIVLV
jgi:two-component system phosphate regulon response regulator OmpR